MRTTHECILSLCNKANSNSSILPGRWRRKSTERNDYYTTVTCQDLDTNSTVIVFCGPSFTTLQQLLRYLKEIVDIFFQKSSSALKKPSESIKEIRNARTYIERLCGWVSTFEKNQLILAGCGMGAALAKLAALYLHHFEDKNYMVIGFGGPGIKGLLPPGLLTKNAEDYAKKKFKGWYLKPDIVNAYGTHMDEIRCIKSKSRGPGIFFHPNNVHKRIMGSALRLLFWVYLFCYCFNIMDCILCNKVRGSASYFTRDYLPQNGLDLNYRWFFCTLLAMLLYNIYKGGQYLFGRTIRQYPVEAYEAHFSNKKGEPEYSIINTCPTYMQLLQAVIKGAISQMVPCGTLFYDLREFSAIQDCNVGNVVGKKPSRS